MDNGHGADGQRCELDAGGQRPGRGALDRSRRPEVAGAVT